LEENSSLQECSDSILLHFDNLKTAVKLGHPFAQIVCSMYGIHSFKPIEKDIGDFVLVAFREFVGNTSLSQIPSMNKGLADYIFFTRKFFV
jgi:hypothetical protein